MRHFTGNNGAGRHARLREILPPVLIFLAGILLGYALRRTLAEPRCIPNDCFAVQGTGAEEEAKQAMMLKMVCLTFDDGPSKYTGEVLNILDKYDVQATFFVTAQEGNLDYYPKLREAEKRGHQIAMHSATHRYSQIYESSEAFWLDIKNLRKALSPYIDIKKVNWLRFPGGSTNTISHRYGGNGIMKRLINEAADRGYEWIDWNVCAEDATASHPNAARILRNIQKDAEGRDICVVLMHDTKANAQTVKALPDIIEWFRDEGYHFCTVDDMYEMRRGD